MATPKSFLEQPRTALSVLAGYFLLNLLLRSVISDSLQTDEAEQSLVTQVWLWGYGSQPPLYTWLQILIFAVCGVNVFALALLKNLLLFSIYLFTYLTSREIFRDSTHALLATFSLLFIILFSWESQRDQTHLVLATAVAAATVYGALRLFKTRGAGWYCLFGVLAGLGVMAKYNYGVVIVSLLLAAISLPALRPAVLDRKILLTLVCFLMVIAPHAHWAWTHPKLLLSQSGKFSISESGDFLMASLRGGGLMLKRIFDFAVGPVVVYGLLVFRAPRISAPTADLLSVALLRRMMGIGLAVCLVTVLAFHVTAIRARWLQPLLISLPLVFVAWAQPRLDQKRITGAFTLACLIMLAVPTVLYGRIAAAGWMSRPTNLNFPYRTLAGQMRAAGFTHGLILTDGHNTGGNLRLCFPDSTIQAADNIRIPVPDRNRALTLVVWRPPDKSKSPGQALKEILREFQIDPDQLPTREISAPVLYAPAKSETLCYALFATDGTKPPSPAPQGSAMQ